METDVDVEILVQPLITAIKKSNCKRNREHDFQVGKVASSVTKRKALHIDFNVGKHPKSLNVLKLIPDDILLSYAYNCNINMSGNASEHTSNLAFVRDIEEFRLVDHCTLGHK